MCFAQLHQLDARDVENHFLARKLRLEFAELCDLRLRLSNFVFVIACVGRTLHTLKPRELVHFSGPTVALAGNHRASTFLALVVPHVQDIGESLVISVHRNDLRVDAFH